MLHGLLPHGRLLDLPDESAPGLQATRVSLIRLQTFSQTTPSSNCMKIYLIRAGACFKSWKRNLAADLCSIWLHLLSDGAAWRSRLYGAAVEKAYNLRVSACVKA